MFTVKSRSLALDELLHRRLDALPLEQLVADGWLTMSSIDSVQRRT
jgi:hypothetical protein